MKQMFGEYEIDDDLSKIDFETVHGWLTTSYWSPGCTRERVERAAEFSALVLGVYYNDTQVGYMRAISDKTSFAWIADVFVDPAYRKRGIAKAMVQFTLAHPDYQTLRRWLLATADAHDVYKAVGFESLENPDRFLAIVRNANV